MRRWPAWRGARESLFGDLVRESGLLPKMAEAFIEFGVDAFTHPAQHDGHQCRQRQLAAAYKRADMVAVTCAFMKLRGVHQCGEIGKQRGQRHGRPTKIKSDLHWLPTGTDITAFGGWRAWLAG